VKGRGGIRRQQLIDEFTKGKRYWNLEDGTLDRAVWRTHFGRGQKKERINESTNERTNQPTNQVHVEVLMENLMAPQVYSSLLMSFQMISPGPRLAIPFRGMVPSRTEDLPFSFVRE